MAALFPRPSAATSTDVDQLASTGWGQVGSERRRSRISERDRPAADPSARSLFLDLSNPATCAALGRLHDERRADVGARTPWLQAWAESHPQWRPRIMALPDGPSEIAAVLPLAEQRRPAFTEIRLLGDHCSLVCRSDQSASALADGLLRRLRALGRPWSLQLGALPSDSAFTELLVRELRAVRVEPGAQRPMVVLEGRTDPAQVMSRNLRKAEAKARNRLAGSGLQVTRRWLTGRTELEPRLAEIRSVHRERDLQLRRSTALDDARESAFYDALLRRHLDQMDLLELRVDGELAAFVIWIRNGPVRTVLDNRVAPRFMNYSAGLLANNIALRAAAADPEVETLDWGPGVQRYKLQSANLVIGYKQLSAWSSPLTRRAVAAGRRVRGRVPSLPGRPAP